MSFLTSFKQKKPWLANFVTSTVTNLCFWRAKEEIEALVAENKALKEELAASRRNWDSPTPYPQASVPTPPFGWGGGGAHSLTREGLGGSQFRRGNIHSGTPYTSTYISTLWYLP